MGSDVAPHSVAEVLGAQQRTSVSAAVAEPPPTGHVAIRFLKCLGKECLKDSIDDVGAMMAYYAVLSLFPMMVFIVTLAVLVVDDQDILRGLGMVTQALPGSTRQTITDIVKSFLDTAGAGFAVGGALLALWGASRGVAACGNALNTMFNKRETRSFLRRQLTAIGVTVGVALMVVTALALLVIGPAVGHYVADRFGLGSAFDTAWSVMRWVSAGLLVMTVFSVLYKFLPNTSAPFRIFTPGAAVAVLMWLGISALFGLYLDAAGNYDKTYGALGGAIVFLTWLWLSNIAFLFGAEFNDVLADFRKHKSVAAAQLSDVHEASRAPEVKTAAAAKIVAREAAKVSADDGDAAR